MGCPPVLAFAVAYPETALSMVLYWPVGGARYRLASHARFSEHLAYVQDHGLEGVVALARSEEKSFSADPRGGPWRAVIRRDAEFARTYAAQDVDSYTLTVSEMARTLFDRDTAPGAEPEDLLRLNVPALVVPGHDPSHATSAARYLEECIPHAEYWDAAVDDQTEASAPAKILEFLRRL